MKNVKMFAVRDVKIGSYGNPFPEINRQDAVRGFLVAVRNKDGKIGQFPADFELYEIGSYDQSIGKIEPNEVNELVITGSDCVQMEIEVERQQKRMREMAEKAREEKK